MGDFFKEWKRKLGLLTLVMACVAMVGWVRSITITDNIDLPFRGRTVDAIESAHGELFLVRSKIEVEQEVRASSNPERWQKVVSYSNENGFGKFGRMHKLRVRRIGLDRVRWQWRHLGIGIGQRSFLDNNILFSFKMRAVISDTVWAISYQSLVLPLTFVSAFLLLSNPKTSAPMKVPEPTVDEEGGATK